MNLFMVGVDHTSAPVAIRERLAFNETALADALALLTQPCADQPALLKEAVIISTCNRVEVYGVAEEPDIEDRIAAFLANFHGLDEDLFTSALFFHFAEEAIYHLFETTAGLRSLILGEAQIQGQVRKAFLAAQRVRSVGPILRRLFSSAIANGKRVRHETSLGQGAASVSQAGIELAERRIGSLDGCSVLLVGSGKMSELAAQNLLAHGARNLMVINRTYERAVELARRYGAQPYPFEDLQQVLNEADIVISSTSSPRTIIHQHHIATALDAKVALRARAAPAPDVLYLTQAAPGSYGYGANGTAPYGVEMLERVATVETVAELETLPEMLLIDLAVPRDIDQDVAEVPGAHLCTIDDLKEVVSTTMDRRSGIIYDAQQIVDEEVEDFCAWLRSQNTLPILSSWRQQAEDLRSAELKRAMRRLESLSPEEQYVVEAFSRSLVNKLLHNPTLRTRHAAAAGNGQRYAQMIRDLWGL